MGNKNLRTPIIKARSQGGTFFTFGSAMEDIGLNINERTNKVELSHYAILDIPTFSSDGSDDTKLNLNAKGRYEDNVGDMLFTESFQNYVLNFETVVRNQNGYNFASTSTVSEKIFWKWLFKDKSMDDFVVTTKNNTTYYRELDPIVKGFGKISAGAQRSDDYGIYNETFVQIPSSYGQMECLFKCTPDENYNTLKEFSTTSTNIENISNDEITETGYLLSTGIHAERITDTGESYTVTTPKDMFSLEMDINKLIQYYDSSDITYDTLGFGEHTSLNFPDNYSFNAILVYYSVYDASGNNILATNAYGIYLLDKSVRIDDDSFEFPRLSKKKTTTSSIGTSFSFRINIKTTSAYSGDVKIIDNSTSSYAASEDFNDVLKNLNSAVRRLNDNAMLIYKISNDYKDLNNKFSDLTARVNETNDAIEQLKNDSNTNEKITIKSDTTINPITLNKSDALQIVKIANVTYDTRGNLGVTFESSDISTVSEVAQHIIRESLRYKVNGTYYYDVMKYLLILTAALK